MSKTIEKSGRLSKEEAQYLSERGMLSAQEEAKYGIKSNPLGGTPPEATEFVGDVGSLDSSAPQGPTGAPDPKEVAAAASSGATNTYEEMSGKDLLAEVKSRNSTREGDDKIKPESRSKEDLIAALEADDQ